MIVMRWAGDVVDVNEMVFCASADATVIVSVLSLYPCLVIDIE